jgi:hypothetical protein
MPRPSPAELAFRMGARSRRADDIKPLSSVSNEIEEIKTLHRQGVLSEREFYVRLRRLGVDVHAANELRRGMRI